MNSHKVNLTRTQFSRLMRGYSNQSNKTVDRQLWKRIKASAIDSNVLGYEVTYDSTTKVACIAVNSRWNNGALRYTTKLYPTLTEFINYIFFENKMGRPIDNQTLKTDFMNNTTLDTISNVADSTTTVASTLNEFKNLTINATDFYKSVQTSVADMNVQPWNGTVSISSNADSFLKELNDVRKDIDKLTKKEKENKTMFNFDFGKITSDTVRISMYGIAVKNVDGRYVSYDKTTHSVMDVEILNMPAGDFLYKMPVAIKDVKAGDVVIHNRVPMFVVETHESTMKVIDIREGTEKEIYLTKSPFGFNFATKVISLMDMTGAKADESNPFGNMLPFMLMSDNKDFDPMMLMVMSGGKFDMSNPMMMYFMMKDTNHKDLLPMMLAMNMKG